jgi:hypothetical protein
MAVFTAYLLTNCLWVVSTWVKKKKASNLSTMAQQKLFPDHLSFIRHGALVGAGSLPNPF